METCPWLYDGVEHAPHHAALHTLVAEKDKRIAELEAELAEFKAERKARHYVHAEFSCAEADRKRKKAEAEVERMRQFHQLYCHPDADCQEGVNPSGDTLGKERDDG